MYYVIMGVLGLRLACFVIQERLRNVRMAPFQPLRVVGAEQVGPFVSDRQTEWVRSPVGGVVLIRAHGTKEVSGSIKHTLSSVHAGWPLLFEAVES